VAVNGEALAGHHESAPAAVERVGLAAPVAEGLVLDPAPALINAWFASFTTWNGSATWTASGSIVSNTDL
jgi:hypothetical protein